MNTKILKKLLSTNAVPKSTCFGQPLNCSRDASACLTLKDCAAIGKAIFVIVTAR